ncbi:MAG: hypothetical protein P1V81_04500 [Planctomycetota bacterium]|nr:hypothetical protein [Planctomycetota bacterium]
MKHVLGMALASLLLSAPAALASGGGLVLVDDFTGGVNQAGWSYNPGDVIEATGGNPGGWWHQASADTFAPIISSDPFTLAGDYRAEDIGSISFDARLDHMDFGDGTGFNMAILLRDHKGTVTVTDDDYAYYVGPNIPLQGAGWKAFDFAIPSQDTSATPAGWTGGWVGDCCGFRPGVDWNDVITSVDRVEIWFIDPSFFAIFQNWDVGLDNIQVKPNGSATLRNGAGGNPLSYTSTSVPTIGAAWTASVDIATPGHPLSFVAVSNAGAISGVFPGGTILGELLVQPTLFSLDIAAGSHSFPLPASPALMGLCLATQGGTISGSGTIHLGNALDVLIGG